MVTSGFAETRTDVAPYALATHLAIAFVIFAWIIWLILTGRRENKALLLARRERNPKLDGLGRLLVGFLFVQILLGALVAGTDAGQAFPTWPLMNGEFFPSGSFSLSPPTSNFFENPGLTQFNHRIWGYLTFLVAVWFWFKSRRCPSAATKRAIDLLTATVFIQVAIGIFTALYAAQAHIAITHQLIAMLVFGLAIRASFLCRFPITALERNKLN